MKALDVLKDAKNRIFNDYATWCGYDEDSFSEAIKELEDLKEKIIETIESLSDFAEYTPDYFKSKYDLDSTLKDTQEILNALKE